MLKEIAENIYAAEGDMFIPGGVHFPVRMTIVRLDSQGLWLHSPIAIDDRLASEINSLGEVRWLVAPNCFHHLFLKKASARWPEARILAAPGVAEKRKDIAIHEELGNQEPAEWKGFLKQRVIDGLPRVNEVVFLHVHSGSLILTDLLFNVAKPRGWQSWLLLTMAGVRGRFSQSRMIRLVTRDRSAACESVRQMLAWPFERVIMTHGEIVTKDARERVKAGLSWMLRNKNRPNNTVA